MYGTMIIHITIKYLVNYLSTHKLPLYKSDSSKPLPANQCNTLNLIFCSLNQSIFMEYSLLTYDYTKTPLLKKRDCKLFTFKSFSSTITATLVYDYLKNSVLFFGSRRLLTMILLSYKSPYKNVIWISETKGLTI